MIKGYKFSRRFTKTITKWLITVRYSTAFIMCYLKKNVFNFTIKVTKSINKWLIMAKDS